MDRYLPAWNLPTDWMAKAPIYRAATSHLPADILEAAMLECVRTMKWFPTVAEVLGAAKAEHDHRARMLALAEREVATARDRLALVPPADRATPEEAAAGFAAVRAAIAAVTPMHRLRTGGDAERPGGVIVITDADRARMRDELAVIGVA